MSSFKYKLTFEIISLIGAAIIGVLLILPIIISSPNYQFLYSHFIFIFLFITFSRYIFFLKFTLFSRYTPVKLVFIFLTIPLAVLLTDEFSKFQEFSDTVGLQELVKNMNANKQSGMTAFIKNQMLFFGAGSVVATILLAFRMLISIWRVRNRDRV